MAPDYREVLLDYLLPPAGQVADFVDIQPPAYKEFYALVIFDVPVHGLLTVVYLPGDVRRGYLFFVEFKDDPLVGDPGTHVELVAFDVTDHFILDYLSQIKMD